MHLALGLAVLLPERAHVLLLVGNVAENGHQLKSLLLLLVLLGCFRGPRLVGAEEFGGLGAAEVRALPHFVEVKHEFELLVGEVDQFRAVDVGLDSLRGLAVEHTQLSVELGDVLQDVDAVLQALHSQPVRLHFPELVLSLDEAGLYLVALLVDVPVNLGVKVVEIGVEGLGEALRDWVEGLPDELGNGRQVKRN